MSRNWRSERRDRIWALAQLGHSAETVQKMLEIKDFREVNSEILRRRALQRRVAARQSQIPARQPGATQCSVSVSIETLDALEPSAAARGVTVNELAGQILEMAVSDDLVPSIMDDGVTTQ